VRGARATLPARKAKADVLLVAVRYGEDGQLQLAKGYVRHDQVWSDVKLFDRQTLVDMLRFGRPVATATFGDLATDFLPGSEVELETLDGKVHLTVKGQASSGDDLGLPLF
jgi:hypothetical protein